MRIITIIGARPQFIKAAVVSRAIQQLASQGVDLHERLLHTGQHYDDNMSDLFFRQLALPAPQWHLHAGSDIDAMQQAILPILQSEQPDIVLVYGDTNSTLAGARAAHLLHIPIAHVEAGLRSFNMAMPEERNRIETDRLATWRFCPTQTAVANLKDEGLTDGLFHVGDVMYDAALLFTPDEQTQETILNAFNLTSKQFALATIHRAATAENSEALMQIISALRQIGMPVLLPLHPHTAKTVNADHALQQMLQKSPSIRVIQPIGYIETLALERHAAFILTDSGGMQKEAFFQRTPCITLRDETEWTETVRAGWNRLAGTTTGSILNAIARPFRPQPLSEYGDGHAAYTILRILKDAPPRLNGISKSDERKSDLHRKKAEN